MANDGGQLVLVFRHIKQAGVNTNLAAGQGESVDLFTISPLITNQPEQVRATASSHWT